MNEAEELARFLALAEAHSQHIINADYPIPDPEWDYEPLWHALHGLNPRPQDLIDHLAQLEEATPESDRYVRIALRDRLGWPSEQIDRFIP